MKRPFRSVILIFLLAGCVEPYEFVIKDKEPRLVVEGIVSDKSYNETLLYPSDGRRFTVRLTYTHDVNNERVQPVTLAVVTLIDDSGGQTVYSEKGDGLYEISDPDFKAQAGLSYKLKIRLSSDEVYESSWESLPLDQPGTIGEITFAETEIQTYKYVSGERVVRPIQGIDVLLEVPARNSDHDIYYKWDFTPGWVFIAPLPSPFSPVKKCWVGSPYYLADYQLEADHSGGYKKRLFFLPTVENERVLEDFTVLVRQLSVSSPYYYFLEEMKEQDQGALLSDKPPFNLETNIVSLEGARPAIGYFAVTSEKAIRWYFNTDDLSYHVPNNLKDGCMGEGPFVPPPGCVDCTQYANGESKNIKPTWWRD